MGCGTSKLSVNDSSGTKTERTEWDVSKSEVRIRQTKIKTWSEEPLDIFAILRGEAGPPQSAVPVNKDDIKPFQRKILPPTTEEPLFSLPESKVTRLEDTFWPGKKELIPDLDVFKSIEDHALAAPNELRSSSIDLAKFLVEPAKSDLEKLRAIWWWVTHNISYDVSYLNHGTQAAVKPEDVLLTGKSICQGYSDLCKNLLSAVGVTCEVISGAARSAGFWPGCHSLDPDRKYGMAHAWNKVKLGNKWYLFDSTWGAGGTGTGAGGMTEFNFTYREHWFLSDPEGFMSRHLPIVGGYDDNNPKGPYQVQVDQQLIPNPQASFEAWKEQPYEEPGNLSLGFRPKSHTSSLVYTKDNSVTLAFTTNIMVKPWATLEPVMGSKKGTTLKEHVLIVQNMDMVRVTVRTPGSGKYVLKILGYPASLDETLKTSGNIMFQSTYTIVAEGNNIYPPYPKNSQVCGPKPIFIQAGFKIIAPENPYIESSDGKATVSIRATEEALAYLRAYLTTPDGVNHFTEYVYLEKMGDRANIYVCCPTPGQFRLQLQLQFTKGNVEALAVFVVNCTSVRSPTDRYPRRSGSYGPQPLLYKHGVSVVNPKGSSIIAPEGQCQVTSLLDHPMQYFCCIFDEKENQAQKGQTYTQIHGNCVTVHARIHKAGLYRMDMNFRERGATSWDQIKASFLLIVPKPCERPPLPDQLTYGHAWCELDSDGLEYEGGYKSTLQVHQSTFDVRFKVKPDVTIAAKLFPGDKWIHPELKGNVAVHKIVLPELGEYILSIMKKKATGNSYEFMQHFLINRISSYNPA